MELLGTGIGLIAAFLWGSADIFAALASLVAFFHLPVDQPSCHLPPVHVSLSLAHLEPLSKMSRERIEVQIEPITGKERDALRGQDLPQGVDHPISHWYKGVSRRALNVVRHA